MLVIFSKAGPWFTYSRRNIRSTVYDWINRPNDRRVVCLVIASHILRGMGVRTEYGLKEVQKDIPPQITTIRQSNNSAVCITQSSTRGRSQSWQLSWSLSMREKGLNAPYKRISLWTMSTITQGWLWFILGLLYLIRPSVAQNRASPASRKLWDFIWISAFLHLHESEDRWGSGTASRLRCLGIGFCPIPWHWTSHKVKKQRSLS